MAAAPHTDRPRALALISGGLASMLAARADRAGRAPQGHQLLHGLLRRGPHPGRPCAGARARPKRNNALWVAEQLGIPLHIEDVVEESGADDRLLHPLSARHLEPTLPERAGWVDRGRLFGLEGRSRRPQIELAQRWGIEDYARPAADDVRVHLRVGPAA